jgi:hypothetical protein
LYTVVTVTTVESYFQSSIGEWISYTVVYHTEIPTTVSIEYTYVTVTTVESWYSSAVGTWVSTTVSYYATIIEIPSTVPSVVEISSYITVITTESFFDSSLNTWVVTTITYVTYVPTSISVQFTTLTGYTTV